MTATTLDLLRAYGRSIDALYESGVVRTKNVVGCYGEHLFARAFEWTLQGNSQSAFDAIDAQGATYQVKSRRVSARNPSRQLGDMPPDERIRFDVLAAVVFAEDFAVHCAVLIPKEALCRLRSGNPNRPRFHLRDSVLGAPGVQDVTAALLAAQAD
jgi:hypothetical protein